MKTLTKLLHGAKPEQVWKSLRWSPPSAPSPDPSCALRRSANIETKLCVRKTRLCFGIFFVGGGVDFDPHSSCKQRRYLEAASLFECTGSPSAFPHQCLDPAKKKSSWIPSGKMNEKLSEEQHKRVLPPWLAAGGWPRTPGGASAAPAAASPRHRSGPSSGQLGGPGSEEMSKIV